MNETAPNVLFVLPRMVTGGVERVTLNLIAEFRRQGIHCSLALRHVRGALLDEAASLVEIDDLGGSLRRFVPRLTAVLKQRSPTHVITAFSDVALLTLLAMHNARSDAKLLHGVHNIHAAIGARRGPSGWLRHQINNWLAHWVYRYATTIVAVTEGLRGEVIRRYGAIPEHVVAIHNPVLPAATCATFLAPRDHAARLVSLGRLEWQKGFDLLIEAVSKMDESLPWTLDIWGDGSERERLAQQITQLGLQDRVRLRGPTNLPLTALREASVFVMASRCEGFGNTLVEALAQGTQVIAFDCPYGPREILEDGRFGTLVPVMDTPALAAAIARSLTTPQHIPEDVLRDRAAKFSIEAAAERWIGLLYGDGQSRNGHIATATDSLLTLQIH